MDIIKQSFRYEYLLDFESEEARQNFHSNALVIKDLLEKSLHGVGFTLEDASRSMGFNFPVRIEIYDKTRE